MIVNGEKFDLAALGGAQTLAGLIAYFNLAPQRVAVELNGDLIGRGAYEQTALHDNDALEIIHYVGGG
ncbi:MAG: sulfur carrier protein ThiS [Spirochaetes bacterium]|nr:sulfur carrier protein ThiS [Spirochaetota bacterium]